MRSNLLVVPLLVAAAAGCGGGAERVSIRGDFADSASAATRVRAVEAAREVEVERGGFELRDLAAGPATLRLVRGTDSSAVLALDNAPAGAKVVLHALRTDARSGRAFPRAVELTGAELLLVNGVRMAGDDRLPAEIDAPGSILALSAERDAILVRPDDASLADLRVVVGLATETVTTDGDPVDLASLGRGDSLRVQGRVDHGFVVARRLTVDRRAAIDPAHAAVQPAEPRVAPEPVAAAPAGPRVVPPPVRIAPAREQRGGGRARGGGRGHGKRKG
jgi:hypothetical protein